MSDSQNTLDLLIIGAAAAGSAAAVYAARRNLNVRIVAKDVGGEVALSGDVENWPGTIHTTGYQLAQDFNKHVASYEVPTDIGFEVLAVEKDGPLYRVSTQNSLGEKKEYSTRTIIVASGIHPRHLHIAGEEAYKNKGVTYCTVCDGPLYKGKVTTTIGAGNAAVESALMMAGIAKTVYVITKYPDTKEHKGGFPKAENIMVDKMKALDNVKIIYNAMTQEILGDQMVSGVRYKDIDSGDEAQIDTNGVMVHIGMIPNSGFIDIVDKNTQGEIIIDAIGTSSEAGIFAAGDVTTTPYKQIAIATGQGVTAALSAIDYLNKFDGQ